MLPRLASKPNRALIAKDAGLGRSTFYDYPALTEMLDGHDDLERKQNEGIPLAPLVALRRYLGHIRDGDMALPLKKNGQPNIVAVSKAIGCCIHIFYKKGKARSLLAGFVASNNLGVTKTS